MNEIILTYLDKVLDINKHINLTHITDKDKAILLHIEDSLAALPEINHAPAGLYMDIGSGGGFPGVPLAIESKRKTVLVDSVQKKMRAVQNILEELGLDQQISTDPRRIEDVSKDQKEQYAVITARALSQLPTLVELASPLLIQHGQLICLKAKIDEEEISHAEALCEKTGLKLKSRRSFFLSDNETYREIIVFEKIVKPTIQLPRKVGAAQKKPLKP